MIETMLTKAQAEELFNQNCALFFSDDGVMEHRVIELFGESMIDKLLSGMEPGRDYNGAGSCAPNDPCLTYLYKRGFFKIVAAHNHRLQIKEHRNSEAGKALDAARKKISDELDRLDAEDERKRRERAEKRKAARKAREEAKLNEHDI